ncbi:MAG: glycoside hydrolase family 3 N-terminal domain-containing protein [Fidelibacterota bacterium]
MALTLLLVLGCAVSPPLEEERRPAVLGIDDLSLEERVAQLFMARYTGNFYPESSYVYRHVKRLVEEKGIGGIIPYFGSTHGTISNLNELQGLSRVPLLVAADYERGVGQQLDGATLFPTPMAVAATGSPGLAYEMGRITALEARAIGVHVTFAPVLDVNSNPDNPIINFRSFGDSPEIVARYGTEFIRGAQEHGLVATGKHFPGHGDTDTDSHTTLPAIGRDPETFVAVDLAPFKRAVDAGVKMIMVAHIAVPSLDASGMPATLSQTLNDSLLRDELGFDGLIVTDAMEMGGITESFWAGEAAIRTLESGTDMVLLPMDIDRAIEAVVEAVRTGRISEERINQSVRRVLTVKKDLGLWEERELLLGSARSVLGRSEYRSLAAEMGRKSITLVTDRENRIPIHVETVKNPIHILLATHEGMLSISKPFSSDVERMFENENSRFMAWPLGDAELQAVVEEARKSDFILCSLWIRVRMNLGTVSLDESHRRLLKELENTGIPVVVVSFGSPYVEDVGEIGTYACAYGYGSVSQHAMADAIFGAVPVSGSLPVTLGPSYPQGHGLTRSARRMLTRAETTPDFLEAKKVLASAIEDSVFPGAQVVVTREGEVLWSYTVGKQTYDPKSPSITEETIYDLASVTKVSATTPLIMKLVERKLLSLDEPVYHFFPTFRGKGKETVTVRHLLTHSSGLPAYVRFFEEGVPPEEVVPTIVGTELDFPPGDSTVYSDLGLILTGAIIQKVTGQSLDVLAKNWIYEPLGMKRTFFRPDRRYLPDIAPTEYDPVYRKGVVHGVVHDENTWWLGGVAGHAGLFSTALDLARYAQVMMDGGVFEGRRLFKRQTIAQFTARQGMPPGSSRAVGWDTPSDSLSSAGDYFGPGSFGHLGFTGTSLWIDPNRRIAVILLTNRVYPTRERGGMYEVRRQFYNAVMQALERPRTS